MDIEMDVNEVSAKFVAELVRQGVKFRAHETCGRLTLTFTGGY